MTSDDQLEISVDAERIRATLVSPSARLPGVLLVHGWGGSQQQYLARAREIARLGRICLTFDLRGNATWMHIGPHYDPEKFFACFCEFAGVLPPLLECAERMCRLTGVEPADQGAGGRYLEMITPALKEFYGVSGATGGQ